MSSNHAGRATSPSDDQLAAIRTQLEQALAALEDLHGHLRGRSAVQAVAEADAQAQSGEGDARPGSDPPAATGERGDS